MSNKLFNVFNRKVSESDFIKIFGSIYEHSEWVPKNIIKNNSVLPDTIENLGLRMKEEVDKASNEKKLELWDSNRFNEEISEYFGLADVLFLHLNSHPVFKNQFPTSGATWLIVGLVVFMAASIQFYARWRRLNKEQELLP